MVFLRGIPSRDRTEIDRYIHRPYQCRPRQLPVQGLQRTFLHQYRISKSVPALIWLTVEVDRSGVAAGRACAGIREAKG